MDAQLDKRGMAKRSKKHDVKKLSVGIYAASLGLFLLVLLIVIGIFVLGVSSNNSGINMAIGVGLNFGILAYLQFMAVHTIFNFLILSRMWGAIQDGQTQITVGKAIGFLFIPFFNIYWIFRAWGSFPKIKKDKPKTESAPSNEAMFLLDHPYRVQKQIVKIYAEPAN